MTYHDRVQKLWVRRHRMPVNGIAFKRLLVERAANAKAKGQKEKKA